MKCTLYSPTCLYSPHDPVILQPFSLVVLGIITTFANEK